MCHMTVKKSQQWREFYWLSFALNFSFVGAKMRILFIFLRPFHCRQTKIFFHKKTGIGKSRGIGATNQHEIVTWWSWYFSVQFIFKVFKDPYAWFLHTLGAHKLLSTKTMTTIVGCVSFDKVQYSISKGWLLPTTHTVQV